MTATWAVIYELAGPDVHLVVVTGFKTDHDAKRWGEEELLRGSEFKVKLTRVETRGSHAPD